MSSLLAKIKLTGEILSLQEEQGGDPKSVAESGSSETCLRMSEEEERGDPKLVAESGSSETGLSMSVQDEKWEKESDDSVHEVDDSVSDRNYRPEDSESDASESSDSQLNEIVKIKRRKMVLVSDAVSPPGVGFIETERKG
ncbi:unnamed protein product [Clavelina lepadiformis]|uniref:Uncharacterized protein n=1 Tax=Clavelina lepadiformis TaxID=159417 RepID=A0ABP0G4N6_CLALP